MLRLWNIILALVASGLLFLALGSIEAGSSLSYTCVLCRLGRVDTTLFGFTRSTLPRERMQPVVSRERRAQPYSHLGAAGRAGRF